MAKEKHICIDFKQKARTQRGYIMDLKCIGCKKVKQNNIFPATTFEGFIRRWVHNKLSDKNSKGDVVFQSECGKHYHATPKRIYYHGKGRNTSWGDDTLAIRLPDGRIIGNASRLPRCGSYRKGAEAPAQRVMQLLEMPLIPFSVFEEAKLDLFTATVVEQGKPEKLLLPKLYWHEHAGELRPYDVWVNHYNEKKEPDKKHKIRDLEIGNVKYTPNDKQGNFIKDATGIPIVMERKTYSYKHLNENLLEKRHFVGAMLLKVIVNIEGKEKYFLFDCDRREIEFYNFNAFLSELPKPCKTIKEAYDVLIPEEVREARKKGLKVERQGEWFFIPAKLPEPVKADEESRKIAEKALHPKNFDLKYWKNDGDRIKENEYDEDLSKLKDEFKEAFIARIKAYNLYCDEFEKALKILHREDPEKYAGRGELRANNNRPNHAKKYVSLPEGVFVKGDITHSGREHEPLMLINWCKPVPNTAVNSYTIRGAVD